MAVQAFPAPAVRVGARRQQYRECRLWQRAMQRSSSSASWHFPGNWTTVIGASRDGPVHYRAMTSRPSLDDSFVAKLLAFVLSVIAGSVDIIGFLGLDGLFTAHITGNLVILAARFLADGPAPVAQLISVPVFIVALVM